MLKYSFILSFSYLLSKCLSIDKLLDGKITTTKTFMFWPNATVPFYINPDHFDHEQTLAIMTSLSMFAFKTCLKFAPVMTSPDEGQHVMTFINPDGVRRCRVEARGHSHYDPHLIYLGYECLQSPEIDMVIMRALGLPFEHNRMSRDVYIDVMIQNIEPSYIELFTKDNILPPELRALPYDINSVMHFGEREYSKNGHRTIKFKNHKVRQNRIGLTPTDLRKIELVYGPQCQARDRQEKFELCQSYPGVARRKRQIELVARRKTAIDPVARRKREIELVARRKRDIEPPANKSLRVNPDITPPLSLLTSSAIDTTTETPEPLAEDIKETDDLEYVKENLDFLGIANATEDILEQVYKISAIALRHAREKYCNETLNVTIFNFNDKTVKKSNSSDILGVFEVIADYAKSMVSNAIKNMTAFCQNSDSVEVYQRQCKFGFDDRCPKTYRLTKTGSVSQSTQYRPYIKQPTEHQGSYNSHSYDKNGRDGEITTPFLQPIKRKREVANRVGAPKPVEEIKEKKLSKEKKILKEKAKVIEKLELQKENSTTKLSVVTSTIESKSKENKKDPPRRFYKESRYKIKNPEDDVEIEWEESNTSLDKEKEKEIEEQINEDIVEERDKQREEEGQTEKEIELKAKKIINKDELVKEVFNEGIDSIIDAGKAHKEVIEQTVEDEDTSETDETSEATKGTTKVDKSEDESSSEDENEKKTIKAVESEEVSSSEDENDDEKSIEVTTPYVETITQRKKRRKVKAVKHVIPLQQIEPNTKEVKLQKKKSNGNMQKRKRSQGLSPKTVKLNQLNQEFYNERRWPDGIVRYVIKKLPDYDLEDLRNRIAAVNSILMKKTCVRLQEVDAKEAQGYDDYLVLDTSPDYVTGRVGGEQIFGSVELFRGGQHKQHTAMMVMAMLGFYFEVSRHDRDRYIRVHMRHIRPDKLHHYEKIREEATLDLPYDYKSATHPAWQFWRKIGKTGISTVATYKEQDPDGSVMRSLGQNPELLSEYDIIKINSVYGVQCFQTNRASDKLTKKRHRAKQPVLLVIQ